MRTALRKDLRSLFFPLWEINPSWFLWIIGYRVPQQKRSRLPAPSSLRRTRTHAHADARWGYAPSTAGDNYVSSRCGGEGADARCHSRCRPPRLRRVKGQCRTHKSEQFKPSSRSRIVHWTVCWPTIYRSIDTSIFSPFRRQYLWFDTFYRSYFCLKTIVDYRKQF